MAECIYHIPSSKWILSANYEWKGAILHIDNLILGYTDVDALEGLLLGLRSTNIPVPPLEAVLDDRTNHILGYSFLQDNRNAA